MFARGREKFGCGGKVNHHVVGLRARLHGLRQPFKIGQIVYIDRQVLDAPDKTLPHFFAEMRFDVDFAVAVDFFQEAGCVEFAARYTQNAPFGVQQPSRMRLIQAGQQFAHGQIAGGAE